MIPRISVIIPAYNRANYLTEAINSVLSQTYRNFELIVVNDGSQDNTEEILKKYVGKIKYFYQENNGVSSARNKGIDNSKGEFLCFLDSDDLWEKKKLEKQIDYFNTKNKFSNGFNTREFNNEMCLNDNECFWYSCNRRHVNPICEINDCSCYMRHIERNFQNYTWRLRDELARTLNYESKKFDKQLAEYECTKPRINVKIPNVISFNDEIDDNF